MVFARRIAVGQAWRIVSAIMRVHTNFSSQGAMMRGTVIPTLFLRLLRLNVHTGMSPFLFARAEFLTMFGLISQRTRNCILGNKADAPGKESVGVRKLLTRRFLRLLSNFANLDCSFFYRFSNVIQFHNGLTFINVNVTFSVACGGGSV